MNWSVNQILFILTLLILLNCKKTNDNIGLPSKPQDSIGVFFTDTSTIISNVVLNDSINSSENRVLLVGTEQDPNFGSTTAASYVRISNNGVTIDTDSILSVSDTYLSFKVNLPADSNRFGSINQKVRIYRLPEYLKDYQYYTNSTYDGGSLKEEDLLGETTINLFNKDYVKISLPITLGWELLKNSADTTYLFNTFKGIAIVPASSNNSDAVLTLYNNNDNDSTDVIHIRYKDKDAVNRSFTFTFGSYKKFQRLYTINTDRSNTPLEKLSRNNPVNTSELNNIAYVQAGTGVNTKIEFPFLKNLRNKGIIINKAQLILYVAGNSGSILENPPLQLHTTNNTNRVLLNLTEIINGTSAPVVRYMNSKDSSYVFDITDYIQNSLVNYLPGNGLLIRPVSVNNNNLNDVTVTRTKFYDQNIGKSNPLLVNRRMKLILYYTQVQ